MHPALVQLNLENNSSIGDVGASALAVALQVNNTLTQLNLSGNNVGDEGATALAIALQENTTLTQLILSANSIRGVGASALATALSVNASLNIAFQTGCDQLSQQALRDAWLHQRGSLRCGELEL